MPSNGLQRIPKGGKGLSRHYHTYRVAGKSGPRILILRDGGSQRSVYVGRSRILAKVTKTSVLYTRSSLFEPRPRGYVPDFRGLSGSPETKALEALEQVAVLGDETFQDVPSLSHRLVALQKRQEALENSVASLVNQVRSVQESWAPYIYDERIGVRKASMKQPDNRFLSVDQQLHQQEQAKADEQLQMTKTIEDLTRKQEVIEAFLQQLVLQLNSQTPSIVSRALDRVGRIWQASRLLIPHLSESTDKASDPGAEDYRPSRTTQVARAAIIGAIRVLSPYAPVVLPLLAASAMAVITNVQDSFGLLFHTACLPIFIGMRPGKRKAHRLLKDKSMWKAFFHYDRRRHLSSSPTTYGPRKETAYRDLVDNHPDLLHQPFPMATVLNDLRNLQALRGATSGREYKVAERRLFRVQHDAEVGNGKPLTVRQVTELLEPDDSVGWATIRSRLLHDRVDAIDGLSKEERAQVMFQRVYGIGKTKAEKFVAAGYLTLDQLRDAPLEKAQRIGLELMDDIECLIPRSESEQWRDILLEIFESIDPSLGAELLGSFRRGDYFSSDLDWVLYHPSVVDTHIPRPDNPAKRDPNPLAATLLHSIVDALRTRNLLVDDPLAHGPLSCKALICLPTPGAKARRIDLNFAPFNRRAFYTLAKTGDADLMVHLRSCAKKHGWALNEYGIGPHNENGSAWTECLLEAKEEREIFEFLKVPYLEPEERTFKVYAKRLRIVR